MPSAAQPSAASLSARERTRQAVEQIRADQTGDLDAARGLGVDLTEQAAQQRLELWRERAQQDQNANTDAKNPQEQATKTNEGLASTAQGRKYLQDIQWPEPRQPGKRRVIARPPSAGPDAPTRMAFTPDFSRQRMTLGVMVGRPEMDLPQQELADLNPRAAQPVQVLPGEALSLPDLVNVGLSYSPVMDQALAQLEAATNRAKQARADLLPRLSARYAAGPESSRGANVQTGGFNEHTTSSGSVRLTQPIVNLPLISDWLSEVSNERAANWRHHAARESVALAVTQATINVAAARVVVEHSDEQLRNFSRLLEYVQARAQTGAASAADLERTRTRVLLARQIRIEQQANYKSALLELQRLTGQVPVALRLPYLNQLPALPATHSEMRRLVWNQSYDLRAMRADIEAQRRTLASSQQKLMPTLSLSAERDDAKNVRGTNAKQVDQRVVGVLTWDVSLGGKELYGAGAAAAELNNREAKLTEQGERLMQQVDADFASLQSATLRVAAGQAEQLASASVVNSINEQLRIGRVGSLLEALDAYERHFAARQRLTQTLSQQMQAQAQLLARMGLLSDVQEMAQVELGPKASAGAMQEDKTPVPGLTDLPAKPSTTSSATSPATPPAVSPVAPPALAPSVPASGAPVSGAPVSDAPASAVAAPSAPAPALAPQSAQPTLAPRPFPALREVVLEPSSAEQTAPAQAKP